MPIDFRIIGLGFLGAFGAVTGFITHKWVMSTEFSRKVYKRMSLVQYATMQFFMISMMLISSLLTLLYLPALIVLMQGWLFKTGEAR